MKSMTLPEIRAAIEADPRKLCFLKSIASLTTEQANRIIDFLKFGWARIQAGEDVGAVMAEWKELQRT